MAFLLRPKKGSDKLQLHSSKSFCEICLVGLVVLLIAKSENKTSGV